MALPSLAALLALTVALAGCLGGGAPEDSGGNGTGGEAFEPVEVPREPVRIEATARVTGLYPLNPGLMTDPPSIPTGALVTLTYTNSDLNPLGKHDWALEGLSSAKTPVIDQGQEATIEFTAPPPGMYVYYCTVEGHRDAGMEGTLEVTAS